MKCIHVLHNTREPDNLPSYNTKIPTAPESSPKQTNPPAAGKKLPTRLERHQVREKNPHTSEQWARTPRKPTCFFPVPRDTPPPPHPPSALNPSHPHRLTFFRGTRAGWTSSTAKQARLTTKKKNAGGMEKKSWKNRGAVVSFNFR